MKRLSLPFLVLSIFVMTQACTTTMQANTGNAVISSVSPSQVVAGSTDFTLSVYGSGFVGNAVVLWNGSARATRVVSKTQLQATISSIDIQQAGSAAVTVDDQRGNSAASNSVFVTIQPAASGISISPTTAVVPAGNSQQFSATVTGTTNASVSWNVNGNLGGNSTVGTISGSGLYKAPNVSSNSSVMVTAVDGTIQANASVTIVPAATVSVSISPTSANVQVGRSQQFTATVSGTTNTAVNWLAGGILGGSSSVGTISSTGLYTAPSGVPTSLVTVTAQSAANSTSSANATLTILPAPTPVSVSISPTSASVHVNQLQQFTATVSGTTNTAVNWLVGGILGGNSSVGTISSTGLYTAPSSVPANPVKVTAQSAFASTSSANATVTVSSIDPAALQITTSALADGTVQVPYSVTLAAKGGTTPYSWSIVSGSLPTGLALSSGGVISGIPSTANTYTFTVSATDSSVPSGSTTAQLSLTVMTSSVGEIPSTLFGMHKNAIISQPWPSVSVGAEGKGTAVTWGWIESTRGVYDWTQLDNYFNAAQAHGISFSFSNDSVPQWAVASAYNNTNNCSSGRCNAMVANIADWDAFITAMVNRYKNRGVQMIYELWNEPSLWDFDIGASPQTNYNDMVTLTTHMHDLIRSLDPNAMILAPSGVGTAYMDNYFTSGGTKDVDAVTYHAYYANAEDFIPYAQNYRIHMSTWGLSNKPLWDTEGSWGTANLTSDQQVAFVARWYLLHWSQNVYRMYWYQWDNPTYGQLWDSTSGIHPSGIAYGQVENWMVGATMSTPCSANGTVWTCGFTRPGGYQALAVWDTSGASTYIPASQYTKSRDLSGNTSTITGGSISIGIKPILLE